MCAKYGAVASLDIPRDAACAGVVTVEYGSVEEARAAVMAFDGKVVGENGTAIAQVAVGLGKVVYGQAKLSDPKRHDLHETYRARRGDRIGIKGALDLD